MGCGIRGSVSMGFSIDSEELNKVFDHLEEKLESILGEIETE